jgi:hypothetical protein
MALSKEKEKENDKIEWIILSSFDSVASGLDFLTYTIGFNFTRNTTYPYCTFGEYKDHKVNAWCSRYKQHN